MNYHNTTHSTGSELAGYEAKAANQEDVILKMFDNLGVGCTPSDVQTMALPNAPITSVRRAMTNLTDAGKLTKTTNQRMGGWGRPEYVWKRTTNHT